MHRVLACLLAALTLSAAPFSTGAADAAPASARKAKTGGSETIRSVAEVVAIDAKTRTITLKRDDSNSLTVVAGPSVKNLAQIRVGDFVVAEYGRAKALSMKKHVPTNGATEHGNGPPPAPRGKSSPTGKPSVQSQIIVADIIAIDDKKGFATLKGAKGNVVDVIVKERKVLGALRIGDQVTLEYTEAVAVSVKPARSRR